MYMCLSYSIVFTVYYVYALAKYSQNIFVVSLLVRRHINIHTHMYICINIYMYMYVCMYVH